MQVNVEVTFLFVVTDPPAGIFFGRSACVVNWQIVGKNHGEGVCVPIFIRIFVMPYRALLSSRSNVEVASPRQKQWACATFATRLLCVSRT